MTPARTWRTPRRLVVLSAALTASLAAMPVAWVVMAAAEPAPAPPEPAPVVAAARPVPASVAQVAEPPTCAGWTRLTFGRPDATLLEPSATGVALGLDARAADPALVHAVALAEPAGQDLTQGLRARAHLAWQAPVNACYRTAGVLVTTRLPAAGEAWDALRPAAWVEVVGVPPGRTARVYAALRVGPNERALFTDGWPASRAGRAVDQVDLEVVATATSTVVRVDGREVGRAGPLPGGRAWALLYTTSHGNYGPRPVAFSAVAVESAEPTLLARRTK